MEKRYVQAIKAGLMCGLVIAVICVVLGLASMWINATPEMKTYTNQLSQHYQDTLNATYAYNYSSDNSTPMVYPTFKTPQPPAMYYLGMMISLLSTAITLLGMLVAGVLATKTGGQAKYAFKDAVYMGAISGVAAFTPVFIASLIMSGISLMTGSLSTVTSMIPGSTPLLGLIMLFSTFCCCLPIGIVLSVVLGLVGAVGYVLVSGKLEKTGHSP